MAEVVAIQLVAFHAGELLFMQVDPALLLHLQGAEP